VRRKGHRREKTKEETERKLVERRKRARANAQALKDARLPGFDDFTDEQYIYWLAHGANYLASNYEEAVWTPLFEGMYEEEGTPPEPEDLAKAVLRRWPGAEGEDWPNQAKAVLAWSVQPKETVYTFVLECQRRLKEAGHPRPVIQSVKPYQPLVWETMNLAAERVRQLHYDENPEDKEEIQETDDDAPDAT